jgi:hypothetical protein
MHVLVGTTRRNGNPRFSSPLFGHDGLPENDNALLAVKVLSSLHDVDDGG